jgi:hypothetical protein
MPPSVFAFVAFVAFVALVAFVAFVAFVANGTAPRLPSLTSAPVKELLATFAPFTAFALIFRPVTAFFFSCLAPTLFRGSAWIAATLVPPSATVRARQATTIAGEGRSEVRSFMIILRSIGTYVSPIIEPP